MRWVEVQPLPVGPFPPATTEFRCEWSAWAAKVRRAVVAEAVDELTHSWGQLSPTEVITATLGQLYLEGAIPDARPLLTFGW